MTDDSQHRKLIPAPPCAFNSLFDQGKFVQRLRAGGRPISIDAVIMGRIRTTTIDIGWAFLCFFVVQPVFLGQQTGLFGSTDRSITAKPACCCL